MIITAKPSFANTVTNTQGSQELRSIKMITDATPLAQNPEGVLNNNEPPVKSEGSAEPATEETKPISPQFAELAKRHRSLQVKEREIAAREKALEVKSQGSDVISVANFKADPVGEMLKHITYEQLTNAILASQGNPEVNALKQEVESLKKGVDQKFTESREQQIQYALARKQEAAERLARESDEFVLVRELGHLKDVSQLIRATFEKDGREMEPREALQEIEDFLVEEEKKKIKIDKIRELYASHMPAPAQRPQGMRTLTNKDSASIPLSPKQRAMAAFWRR